MPNVLGKTVSAATVARIVEAYNAGREPGDQLTAQEIQAQELQRVVTKVRKYEKAKAITAAALDSDFDLV